MDVSSRARGVAQAAQDPAQETLQRTRRIETRLTQLMIGLGVDTQSSKPAFCPDATGKLGAQSVLLLPSPHTPLNQIIAALPNGWTGTVQLVIGDDLVGTLCLA